MVTRKLEKTKLKFMSDIFQLPSAAPERTNKSSVAKSKLDFGLKHITRAIVSLSDKLINLHPNLHIIEFDRDLQTEIE